MEAFFAAANPAWAAVGGVMLILMTTVAIGFRALLSGRLSTARQVDTLLAAERGVSEIWKSVAEERAKQVLIQGEQLQQLIVASETSTRALDALRQAVERPR